MNTKLSQTPSITLFLPLVRVIVLALHRHYYLIWSMHLWYLMPIVGRSLTPISKAICSFHFFKRLPVWLGQYCEFLARDSKVQVAPRELVSILWWLIILITCVHRSLRVVMKKTYRASTWTWKNTTFYKSCTENRSSVVFRLTMCNVLQSAISWLCVRSKNLRSFFL